MLKNDVKPGNRLETKPDTGLSFNSSLEIVMTIWQQKKSAVYS